jgi:hypothetical protein
VISVWGQHKGRRWSNLIFPPCCCECYSQCLSQSPRGESPVHWTKKKCLCPLGIYHLVGETKYSINIYAGFFSQQASLHTKKATWIYRVLLESKVSMAKTPLVNAVCLPMNCWTHCGWFVSVIDSSKQTYKKIQLFWRQILGLSF